MGLSDFFGRNRKQEEDNVQVNYPSAQMMTSSNQPQTKVPESMQHNYNKDAKKGVWPTFGMGAADLLKMNCRIMIDIGVIETVGFQAFYQEWERNAPQNKRSRIFAPSIELEKLSVPSSYSYIQVLRYTGCNDYYSFFQHVKGMGTWIFIAEDIDKSETVRSASWEAGAYLRVYKLNKEGKLQNYRPSMKNKPKTYNNTTSNTDAFDLPSQMSVIKKVERHAKNVPGRQDVVYDSKNQPIKLGDEFISNPQSITYQTDRSEMQAKIYQPSWLAISYFEDKAKRMLEKPIQCEGICWPVDLLRNANGEFVGILVPAAQGHQLKQELMSQLGLETNFPQWNRHTLTHLTKVILEKVTYLQDRNILFGLLNFSSFFVKDEDHVYFTEMDTYQIEGYPIMSYERVMQAPELQDAKGGLRLYTKQQDYYEVALLAFMLLMPGKFPYNKGANKSVSESVKKMAFAFRYGKQGNEHGSREYYGLWRFVWSHLGNDLKQAFYYTFQQGQPFSTPEKRKDAHFWLTQVNALESELLNPYDKESLRIFPRTFKRYSGTQTIRCVKCGIEHPYFYFRYPEKKICNSCLGQPSGTHFICKSCNKAFYYDFATLFKYERLVETKDFNMPTHCPYCRADKRKCVSCGRSFPTYRLKENGMCPDCAKIARERIVKQYPCSEHCGRTIQLTQGQVDFYMRKFGKLPMRCEECRARRRNRY